MKKNRGTGILAPIVAILFIALIMFGLHLNQQRLIDEENDRRFGTVEYTLEEAREIVKALVPLPTVGLGEMP